MGDFAVAPCGKPQENDENCEGGQENLGGKPLHFSKRDLFLASKRSCILIVIGTPTYIIYQTATYVKWITETVKSALKRPNLA